MCYCELPVSLLSNAVKMLYDVRVFYTVRRPKFLIGRVPEFLLSVFYYPLTSEFAISDPIIGRSQPQEDTSACGIGGR